MFAQCQAITLITTSMYTQQSSYAFSVSKANGKPYSMVTALLMK